MYKYICVCIHTHLKSCPLLLSVFLCQVEAAQPDGFPLPPPLLNLSTPHPSIADAAFQKGKEKHAPIYKIAWR